MKRSRVLVALSLAAVAVAATGTGAVHLHQSAPATSAASEGSADSRVATPAKAVSRVSQARRTAGDFRRYAIDSRLVMKVGEGALVESAPPTLRLQGSWVETVARTDRAGATMVVAFAPSAIAPPTLAQRDLSRPFSVKLGEDGRVSSVTFARGISGDARQALRAVVAQMQLTRSAAPSTSWLAEEDDPTGRYRASYRQISPTEIERTKDRYDLVLSADGLAPPAPGEVYAVRSATRYQLDDAGALVHLGLREALHVTTGESTPSIDALATLEATLIDAGRGPAPLAVEGVEEALATLTADADRESHDLQMARGADYAAARARLEEIERMDPKAFRSAVTHALPQMRAVLRLDRVAAYDAARALADRSTPPGTAAVLSAALATAGTDEARGALVDLAHAEDPAARLAGARAMVQLQNPDDESIGTLKSLLSDKDKDVASAAALSLGAGVRVGGGASAGDANAAAVAALIAQYNAATDDATRVNLVYALGNAGGIEVAPVMLDALSRGGALAQAGAFGLRFVPGDEVDGVLVKLVAQGPVAVRIAAVQAVLDRDRATWTPRLTAMLNGQLPDTLRQFIASALGMSRGS